MPTRELSHVERVNGLTAHFRNKVREILMREQVAFLKEKNPFAAERLEKAMNEILAAFPSVQEIED